MSEQKYTLFESGALFLGLPVLLIFLFLPLSMLSTWMFLVMWRWFAVPALHMPDVTFWQMWGIGVMVTFWQNTTRALKEEFYESTLFRVFAAQLAVRFVGLGLAYIVHAYLAR